MAHDSDTNAASKMACIGGSGRNVMAIVAIHKSINGD